MLVKPDACKPCPLYGDGLGYVSPAIPEDAEVIVVGQNPGELEEKHGTPLVGATGKMLDQTFLPLAGLDPEKIGRDNVIRCRWHKPGDKRKGNFLPTGAMLQTALRHCSSYDVVPPTVTLLVCMGAVALQKYGPNLKQYEWRGHLLPEHISPYL